MNSIEIKNLRVEKPTQPWDVRVDRTSPLGNPFYMRSESERDEVCDKYAAYMEKAYMGNMRFRNELLRLVKIYTQYGKLNLYCWCAPKRCHAESIAKAIRRLL